MKESNSKKAKPHMACQITLKNGRTLAYAEYGDPRGKPVFFFHGMPGSRFFRPSDVITQKAGVRLITTDRPGYGLSSFQPGRRLLDWPGDVAQLADHLGCQRFAVAGHSGGGPYVAACACALPERITSATIISGPAPVDAQDGTKGMTAFYKFGVAIGHLTPWPLWEALVWVFYHRRAKDPSKEMDRGNGIRPAADDEQLEKPAVREACLLSEIEAFRHGLRGLAWEARLITRSWGFRLEDIRVPCFLWHGTDDDQATINMARYVAGKIPGCKITICKHEAHLLLFPHWEEILTQLIPE